MCELGRREKIGKITSGKYTQIVYKLRRYDSIDIYRVRHFRHFNCPKNGVFSRDGGGGSFLYEYDFTRV